MPKKSQKMFFAYAAIIPKKTPFFTGRVHNVSLIFIHFGFKMQPKIRAKQTCYTLEKLIQEKTIKIEPGGWSVAGSAL